MNKNYCIYKHTNKINHKVYIGMTNNPERRWANNGKEYEPKEGRNSRFWGAIQKYGWDGFTHEILITGLSLKEAENAEIKTIAKYDSTNRYKGYNIAKGGNGGLIYKKHPRGMLGHHQTKYEKLVHRKMLSDHTKNPMTNGKTVWGVTNPHPRGMLGHHQTMKHKLAMRKVAGKNSPNHKSFAITKPDGTVLHFDTIKEFISKYKIYQIRHILAGPQPYTLPKANMPNRKKHEQFANCVFKYDVENTETTL